MFNNKYGMEKRKIEFYLHCLEEKTLLCTITVATGGIVKTPLLERKRKL